MKRVLCAVFLALVAAQDLEESFTFFIDLDDFHVTQIGNHEFLSPEAIGEHDNVVVHMSEDEVKYHMDLHNSHGCEPPEEMHEVVSFLQEKMFVAPSTQFIDNVLSSNYGPSSPFWGQGPSPLGFGGAGAFGNMFGNPSQPLLLPPPPSHPLQASDVKPSQIAPSATSTTPPASTANDEEDAVARFREAYRAFHLLNHAVGGLVPSETPSTATADAPATAVSGGSTTLPVAAPAKQGSLWDSLIDDDDRKLFSMFNSPNGKSLGEMFGNFVKSSKLSPSTEALSENQKNFDPNSMDAQIDKIVDDAVKSVFASTSSTPPQDMSTDQLTNPPSEPALARPPEDHHHHHHHHHHEETTLAPTVPSPAAPPASPPSEDLTTDEKKVIASLLNKLTADDKTGKIKAAIREALFADEPAAAPKAEPEGRKDTDEVPTPASAAVAQMEPAPYVALDHPAPPAAMSGASRPLAPVATSHIEKAGGLDLIPESVYTQQEVPFKEVLQAPKHVPKRILIPRMEEPGPVIGGSTRPIHIKIPPSDAFDMPANTRPAPPAQMQIGLGSDITVNPPAQQQQALTQAQTSSQMALEGQSTAGGAVSVKASSVAAANDEALTAPEVVIF